MLDLSICILTYNNCNLLIESINSIINSINNRINFEIIVIDSGSQDNTHFNLRTNFPEIKLVINDKFYGFSAGNNQAFKIATGKNILKKV